ncbi:malate synthase A [Brevibacterium sp. 50QC2O2]|uniref:malate synthase A n=1 Tax=Brevibacterium TaxID=1696 RepID=UPI00211BD620|nr:MULTISPECIES: malate synthase A [unclassified Brevibacterium]MCQ9367703.1 malate synthase A [Brevibacterium sp. 91QC2O2]MCQ9384991.1 malate synthase A [Brevibacterium sp. 68QC2CO]MCQ9387962.1 malate synthase A [Brevibacterium sp. 50QC2O2]
MSPSSITPPQGLEITAELQPEFAKVLTPVALQLIVDLHRKFTPARAERLAARRAVQEHLDNGGELDFLEETAAVRADDSWRVAPPAPGLEDRRVEVTGPTYKKMTINALNSGAKAWLADQEDANTPAWDSVVGGQINLLDAINREIDFTAADTGKEYRLRPDAELPTIIVRPRGWHMNEKHMLIDGEQGSGSLVDFALYFATAGQRQIEKGQGVYYYLPKMESYLEARLWNDVFSFAEDALGNPRGTIRATCLIETYPAAFQMEEFLYELREHSAGLNAGRWDYIFSVIKTHRNKGTDWILPDRNLVTMTVPFMRAYTELLVRTCHKRGAHAIGGMAAQIPSKDPEVNAVATEKVTGDKTREATDGFDGSWVAHPGMVDLCKEQFTKVLGDKPNQIDKLREDVSVGAAELLSVKDTPGDVTEAGLRANINVGIQYVQSWLNGNGAAAIHNLMEDAATAEISRTQVWQWLKFEVTLADTGATVTRELVDRLVAEETAGLPGGPESFARATELFVAMATAEVYYDFLTLPAYELLD